MARDGRQGSPIDTAMAGFAAFAVAFAGWAMPAGLFAQLTASAIPAMAQVAVALALAALVFVAVRALLLRLDPAPDEELRHRRADAHPDAPLRTPLSAAMELGSPPDDLFELEVEEPEEQEASVSDLVERFEQGLARMSVPETPLEPEPEPDVWTPEPGSADDHLRNAIERLQQLSRSR